MPGLVKPQAIGAFDRALAETFGLDALWMLWEGADAPYEQRSLQKATLSASKPTWVAEEEGRALSFASGSSQYVQLRNVLPNLALDGVTVMARFKPKATVVNGMAAGAVEFSTNRALGVGCDSSGHVGAVMATSSGTLVMAAGSNVWTGQFVTAATTCDGVKANVYENGALANSNAFAGSANLTNGYADAVVGCNVETAGTRLPFNGSVLWAAVFGRQLTADEIFFLYANDFPNNLFRPKRGWFLKAAAGGATDATVNLTGVSATGALGTISLQISPNISVTGVAATGSIGSVSVTTGGNASVNVTGVAGSGAVGNVSVGLSPNVTLTGVAGTGAIGTLTASGATLVSITGVSATGSVNTVSLTVSSNFTITGVSGTGFVGEVSVTGATASIWTAVTPAGGSWTPTTPASGIWTAA
jgi:hypothetical protein